MSDRPNQNTISNIYRAHVNIKACLDKVWMTKCYHRNDAFWSDIMLVASEVLRSEDVSSR